MTHAPKRLLPFALLVLFFSVSAHAQPDPTERESLRGVRGISVVVDEIKPELARGALTRERIQSDVETKLRKAGIHVYGPYDVVLTTPKPTTRPFLYVNLSSVSSRRYPGLHAVSITVDFHQNAVLARPFDEQSSPRQSSSTVTTWHSDVVAFIQLSDLSRLREQIAALIDKFVSDYLAVNPKPLP
jgi:hypothetical protein